MSRAKCKGCGAEMIYAVDGSTGENIPLDARAPVYSVHADMLGDLRAVRAEAYVSHFSTCPEREKFSKSARREGRWKQ